MFEHMPELYKVGLIILLVLLTGLVLSFMRQPRVIGYLMVGVLVGPYGLGMTPSHEMAEFLSEMGVILLLFFIGMEVSLERLIRGWRVFVVGTLIQIILSIGFAWLLTLWYRKAGVGDIILIGFVISLSSTAVVLTMLQNWKELDTPVGQDALGILLVQDLVIVPMLIIIGLLGGESPSVSTIALQVTGGLFLGGLIAWIMIKGTIRFPLPRVILEDPELEVFAAIFVCLGFAVFSTLCGLSEALGAFVAGIFVASRGRSKRVQDLLHPFKTIFIALFFVSIGMLVDLSFVWENLIEICLLLVFILCANTCINTLILRISGRSARHSFYGGVLLSQIGEFSFVLAAAGAAAGIMSQSQKQIAFAVIVLSLIVSPFVIGLVRHWFHMNPASQTARV